MRQRFAEHPEKYVSGGILPRILPKPVTREEVKSRFPQSLELKGYCPVTFANGPAGY
jgi:adenylate/nucleoside-diphosphate kinase